ncbi:MAG: hypothetical protein KDE55_18270, partial [Novosphingobium sp.]|nr:hypothetical protein [Novosphingobium sp.]
DFLSRPFLSLKAGAWLAIVAGLGLLVFTTVRVFDNAVEDGLDTARQAGATDAVKTGQDTTLSQIGDANNASDQIRNDAGLARFCECRLSATPDTARYCVRYLENKPVPGGPGDPGELCAGSGRE